MKDNKLGIMPISKLIWNMSLPIIVSMLVQALYNIVDSVRLAGQRAGPYRRDAGLPGPEPDDRSGHRHRRGR